MSLLACFCSTLLSLLACTQSGFYLDNRRFQTPLLDRQQSLSGKEVSVC